MDVYSEISFVFTIYSQRYRVIERNLLMKSNALAQESQEKGNIEEEVKVLTSRITKLQSENQQMFTVRIEPFFVLHNIISLEILLHCV